jgi:hypothetical protein
MTTSRMVIPRGRVSMNITTGSVTLSGDFSPDGFYADLPILMDTGIDNMILWVNADFAPPNLASESAFPAGISVNISAPPADLEDEPALQYSFVTGDTSAEGGQSLGLAGPYSV